MSRPLSSAVAQFDAQTGCHFSRITDLQAHDFHALVQLCAPESYNLEALRAIFAAAEKDVEASHAPTDDGETCHVITGLSAENAALRSALEAISDEDGRHFHLDAKCRAALHSAIAAKIVAS